MDENGKWQELVPKTKFAGHALMQLKLPAQITQLGKFSQVRLEMHPDGGISRLGLYETLPADIAKDFVHNPKPIRFKDAIPKSVKPLTIPYEPTKEIKSDEITRNIKRSPKVDWASSSSGATLVGASNEHYGPAIQVISPFKPLHMFDGLESARSRDLGHKESVTIRLGKPIRVARIELDFTFFVNNNPLFVSILGGSTGKTPNETEWTELVAKTNVKAYAGNQIGFEIDRDVMTDTIKISVYPDGGVHRIRVFE
jgi:allantoicase